MTRTIGPAAPLTADELLLELHRRLGHGTQITIQTEPETQCHVHWHAVEGGPGYARGVSLVEALRAAVGQVAVTAERIEDHG